MIETYCTGLQHIGIPTTDMEKSLDFYNKIGFKTIYSTDIKNGKVYFVQLKNLQLELYNQAETVGKAGAIDHFAIDVTDIDKCYAFATENNMKIISNGIETLDFWEKGIKYFIVEGPNKEKVEFCEIVK